MATDIRENINAVVKRSQPKHVYMINYDLTEKDTNNYADLYKTMESMGFSFSSIESLWVGEFTGTAQDVLNALIPHVQPNDKILVTLYGEDGKEHGITSNADVKKCDDIRKAFAHLNIGLSF